MRIQVATLLLIFSSLAFSGPDEKALDELFKKYDLVMLEKKTDLIDDVFTHKFLRESGGKEGFVAKVKSLPPEKDKSKLKVNWRRSGKEGVYFAKVSPQEKSKKIPEGPEFIISRENGKLKIDGTLGDAN